MSSTQASTLQPSTATVALPIPADASRPITYALVGCGRRGLSMYARPLVQEFSRTAPLVALCDVNQGRMDYYNATLETNIPTFTDFDAMMAAARPDKVIVCTRDVFHHHFILRAFEHGCDVICEKPLAVTEVQCREILAAERKFGRRVTVTFNTRFIPHMTRIRELLSQGAIGQVLSVDFHYLLDRFHGADFFRRWHRHKENSGGLLLAQGSHHFDVINWWLGQDPAQVFAVGALQFYGPTRKERGERCSTCDYKDRCEFYFDIRSYNNAGLYNDVERYDGYIRDRCVFGEDINIEDTMSVVVGYSGGTQLSYSLIAHAPFEGWTAAINGTEGRLEAEDWGKGPKFDENESRIVIHRWNRPTEVITVPRENAPHGGSDKRLRRMLFSAEILPDPLGHMASSRDGAMAALIGVAANHSMREQRPVRIEELFQPG